MSPLKNFATVFGFATASALGTLAFALPGTTFADPVVQVTNEGTNRRRPPQREAREGRAREDGLGARRDRGEQVRPGRDLRPPGGPPAHHLAADGAGDADAGVNLAGQGDRRPRRAPEITKRVEVAADVAKSLSETAANEAKRSGVQLQIAPRAFYTVRFQNPSV